MEVDEHAARLQEAEWLERKALQHQAVAAQAEWLAAAELTTERATTMAREAAAATTLRTGAGAQDARVPLREPKREQGWICDAGGHGGRARAGDREAGGLGGCAGGCVGAAGGHGGAGNVDPAYRRNPYDLDAAAADREQGPVLADASGAGGLGVPAADA